MVAGGLDRIKFRPEGQGRDSQQLVTEWERPGGEAGSEQVL